MSIELKTLVSFMPGKHVYKVEILDKTAMPAIFQGVVRSVEVHENQAIFYNVELESQYHTSGYVHRCNGLGIYGSLSEAKQAMIAMVNRIEEKDVVPLYRKQK